MNLKYFIIALTMVASLPAKGQLSTDSKEALFVEVYMTAKQNHYDSQTTIDSLMAVHRLARSDYKILLRSKLEGDKTPLTTAQAQFATDLKNEEEVHKKRQQQLLKNLCTEVGISLSDYQKIRNRYKTDLPYQRSLKPHFDQYIKNRR